MSRLCRMGSAKLARYLLVTALLWSALPAPAKADFSFGFFYSNLSPHGSWLVSGQYGQVWQPSVYDVGWNPYYDGHWVYSDLGWAWVSDYAWGSIPYHYGTWALDPYLGWVWVPGYVWAPSWVVFRTGPDYIGWCPVPVGYSIGASYSFTNVPAGQFVFVGTRDFLAPRIRVRAVPSSRTQVVLARTKIVNRITVRNDVVTNPGPDVRIIEKARGRRIEALPVEHVERIAPVRAVRREHLRVGPEERRSGLQAARPRSAGASLRDTGSGRGRTEVGQDMRPPEESSGRISRERSPQARREPAVREPPVRREGANASRPDPKQGSPNGRTESRPYPRSQAQATKKPERKPDRKPPKHEPRDSGTQ